jgi:hypothetical protein
MVMEVVGTWVRVNRGSGFRVLDMGGWSGADHEGVGWWGLRALGFHLDEETKSRQRHQEGVD